MSVAIVTGSAGLIGSETVRFFAERGLEVVGIDNDMRRYFFGDDASTDWSRQALEDLVPGYVHAAIDIQDKAAVDGLFARYSKSISVVVHTAAQPSHDWAASEPHVDFGVNAIGTLNLLEATRRYCPQAVFIFTSTSKVYGDLPNHLPLVEHEMRWELDPSQRWAEHGFDETLSIDQSLHSLFGASKVAADILVQEYGRYFGIRSGCFRGGCLTGPGHSSAESHGFLAYLVKCAITGKPYKVFGYGGKQVRDNIHSHDLVSAFWHFFQAPRPGEVYNIGGGRYSNCSILEVIELLERLTGKALKWSYCERPRKGDHIWWISDSRKFQSHFPGWQRTYDLTRTVENILNELSQRLGFAAS